jgi:hypothetical protein
MCEVVDIIARLMIAVIIELSISQALADMQNGSNSLYIISNTGLAPKQGRLFLSLEHLGTGKETPGRDSILDERRVIGTAAKLGANKGSVL